MRNVFWSWTPSCSTRKYINNNNNRIFFPIKTNRYNHDFSVQNTHKTNNDRTIRNNNNEFTAVWAVCCQPSKWPIITTLTHSCGDRRIARIERVNMSENPIEIKWNCLLQEFHPQNTNNFGVQLNRTHIMLAGTLLCTRNTSGHVHFHMIY